MVYVGQTSSRKLIAELNSFGWGECTNRGELPPKRTPWFLDNGAYSDWKHGRAFDAEEFRGDLDEAPGCLVPPDFVVAPDIVAGGVASLDVSLSWRDAVAVVAPPYLAVQDGMTHDDVRAALPGFAGVFVGGTLPWKLRTGAAWAQFARDVGVACHVGRVGTARRVAWARRIGATSIDSCLPLWSKENLATFRRAVQSCQTEWSL